MSEEIRLALKLRSLGVPRQIKIYPRQENKVGHVPQLYSNNSKKLLVTRSDGLRIMIRAAPECEKPLADGCLPR
jgi:hypothetical protein